MYGFKSEFLKMRRNLCELGKLSSNIKIRGAAKGGKNEGKITKRRNYATKKHGIETWYDPTWYDQNRWRWGHGKHGNRSPIFQKAHKKLFSALPILFTQKSVDSVVL